jgi:transposase InsO family protein
VKQIYIESYFRNGYSHFMRYVHDVLEHPQRESIERRLEIIQFFEEFGAKATRRAFGKSRSTIYLWKQKLKEAGGKLSALAPGDRAPKNRRHRVVHPLIERFIIEYRTIHPGVDKTTITPALRVACNKAEVRAVSESTVGRIIHDLKVKGRLPRSNKVTINGRTGTLLVREPKPKKKRLRRKDFVPHLPGDLVQMDTVSIFTAGLKRYIFTAIDVRIRFAFAYAYKAGSSTNGYDFREVP